MRVQFTALGFDRRVLLQFRGSAITSDAGLLPYRELDDTLGLTDTGANTLADARTGKNGRHRLAGLLRQSVFGRPAGYEDVNDAERLCRGDALGRRRTGDRRVCSFGQPDGQVRDEVAEPSREPCCSRRSFRPMDRQGAPPATAEDHRARHGFRVRARPMAIRKAAPTTAISAAPAITAVRVQPVRRCRAMCAQAGQRAQRRWLAGAAGARDHPYRGIVKRLYFWGGRGLRQSRDVRIPRSGGVDYTIRLPTNNILQNRIAYLRKRPVGRPPHEVTNVRLT